MKRNKIRVAITQGDINGIGYEIIIKSLLDPRMIEICTPIVYGSSKVVAYHRKALNIDNFSLNNIKSADEANPKRANIINCLDDSVKVELGKSTPTGGDAAYRSIHAAINDLKNGKVDALVTAPINKDNIQSRNFSFPGHTEYLASQFNSENTLMLMVGDIFKIGVVTGHVPITKMPGLITKESILQKLRILDQSLIEDFGIRKSRIAVLGLNPHAGDNGLIGQEEIETIIPALQQAKEEGILALGPYPADGFFGSGNFKNFDAILAMYHDQGLIPFKSLIFDGVNFTAGLPIIRTSPAHGTAFEIAGKGEASPNSFRNAVYLACELYHNRTQYIELTKNPLQKYEV